MWKRRIEEHAAAVITGAPDALGRHTLRPDIVQRGRVGANPRYQCCTFRGSVTAVTASTGVVRWKSYVIPDEPRRIRTNSVGTQLWGPSGAAIWSSPTVDLQARPGVRDHRRQLLGSGRVNVGCVRGP